MKIGVVIGMVGERALRTAGQLALLLSGAARATISGHVRLREVVRQSYVVGVGSAPLVVATAVLSGIVTAQQGRYQFTGAVPLYVIGSVVASSIVLELGPVITAFVVIGRVGARTAAEIGGMKVSEQIDALKALGRDPVAVLAAPRLLAGLLMMPLLVGLANAAGVLAGMLASRATLDLSTGEFINGARMFWRNRDLVYSLGKALAFGLVIPLVAVHQGFRVEGGVEGVARNTTGAVVMMIVAVLVLDSIFPPLFLI